MTNADSLLAAPPERRLYTVRLLPFICELKVLTKERGVVRFGDVMNYAQIELIKECERQLAETGQIRIIVLKARQIGISTAIEAVVFALSILFHDFQSLILSHEKDSAEHILTMTKRYWDTYLFRDQHTEKYNGRTHLAWGDLGSGIRIGTARNEKSGRSKTIQALHASEIAFWDSPETLIGGLKNSIPQFGLTAMFYESTANGIGNFYHKTWNEASKGLSEFKPLFFPWWRHPEYRAAYLPSDARARHILGILSSREKALRKAGVSDDRLIWRRWAILNNCLGSEELFDQEYPDSPTVAFLATGRNVWSIKDLVAHYTPETGVTGKLIDAGGKLKFYRDETGPLTIYSYPSEDQDWGVYLVGADPTHTTAGDMACAHVLNRRTLEVVAVYRKHIDPINFARELRNLGYYYNTAMICPEKTGPGYATVGALIDSNYPLVWQTQKVDTTPGNVRDLYGWATNRQSKHLAISHLTKAVLDPVVNIAGDRYGLVIHDQQTITEMRDYVTSEDGQGYENGDGSPFDDSVMSLAIAVTCHNMEPPVPAYEGIAARLNAGETPAPPVKKALAGTIEGGVWDEEVHEDKPKVPDPGPWDDDWEIDDDDV